MTLFKENTLRIIAVSSAALRIVVTVAITLYCLFQSGGPADYSRVDLGTIVNMTLWLLAGIYFTVRKKLAGYILLAAFFAWEAWQAAVSLPSILAIDFPPMFFQVFSLYMASIVPSTVMGLAALAAIIMRIRQRQSSSHEP